MRSAVKSVLTWQGFQFLFYKTRNLVNLVVKQLSYQEHSNLQMNNTVIILIVVACTFTGLAYTKSVKELQSNYLRQENVPSIEYKYIVRAVLPQQDRWWKRGTHHHFANSPVTIEA